jgi:hypothetical protein
MLLLPLLLLLLLLLASEARRSVEGLPQRARLFPDRRRRSDPFRCFLVSSFYIHYQIHVKLNLEGSPGETQQIFFVLKENETSIPNTYNRLANQLLLPCVCF